MVNRRRASGEPMPDISHGAPPPLVARPGADPIRAAALAERLGVAVDGTPPAAGLYLELGRDGLALCRSGRPPTRLLPDFVRGPQGFRRARLGPRREAIARACGLPGRRGLTVLDATAGLGRDGFVLAALGARVTLLERSPVVAALLGDALDRAAAHPATADATARMTLHARRAEDHLRELAPAEAPAVVYLDPMFAGTRRAAAGKELALLQGLLPPPGDPAPLLQLALATASERVVVKRHRHAPRLEGQAPDHVIEGKSTRFDVYRRHRATGASRI